jgi:hypothetical protein
MNLFLSKVLSTEKYLIRFRGETPFPFPLTFNFLNFSVSCVVYFFFPVSFFLSSE